MGQIEQEKVEKVEDIPTEEVEKVEDTEEEVPTTNEA